MPLELVARMFDSLRSDVVHAVRSLARRPGFTAAALLTLALGIGANSTVFTLVNALLIRPLPLGAHGDRVVTLHSTHAAQAEDWEDSTLSYDDLQDVRAASRSLEDVGGYLDRSFTVLAGGEAERLRGGSVTPNLFPLLGLQPALGRHFREDEAQDVGHESVVLISHRLFERRFGGDPAAVGRSLVLNGRALTVIGVMPPGVRFPQRDDLWVPYRPSSDPERRPSRTQRFVSGFALLRVRTGIDQAQRELDLIAARLSEQHPDTNRGWGIRALSFRDTVVDRGMRVVSATLLGAVAAVLVIGCANLANLILARGVARQRELAVRSALGASRRRLVRQLLAEALVLCAAGGVLGLLVGAWGTQLMLSSWPEELPYWLQADLDWRVVAFTAGVTTVAALLAGLLPALRSSRAALVSALREGARASAAPGQQRLQSALVVGQIALSLALLAAASLMIRSFLRLQEAPSGMADGSLLTLRFYISGDAYDRVEARAELLRRLEERLESAPGIAKVASSSSIPTDDGGYPVQLAIDGRSPAEGEGPGAILIAASPSFFETLGAGLLEGRTFEDAEHASAQAEVAIVNQRLARRFFPEGALDRRIGLVDGDATRWLRIVGVAPDLQYEEFGEDTAQSRFNVFVPYARRPYRTMALFVRSEAAPRAQAESVRRVFREVDPGLATWDVRTMGEVRAYTTFEQRFFGKLMGAFAVLALLLACLGVYGVLAYGVSRRVHEIGVRLALGARPLNVILLVVRQGARMALAGAAAGLVLAVALGRAIQGILFEVTAWDPLPLAAAAIVLTVVVLLASLLPARRAASVDPLVALRAE
jgi:putative ABC transport system permease protein